MTILVLIFIALCVGAAVGFFVFAMLRVSHTAGRVPHHMPKDRSQSSSSVALPPRLSDGPGHCSYGYAVPPISVMREARK